MNSFLTPPEAAEACAGACAAKTERSAPVLLVLGILAGVLISSAGAASGAAVYGITDTWTARTVSALLFPFGLCMVITAGAELFTGNCLITAPLLDGRCTAAGMLRNWVLVYAGNFAGALLSAAGCLLSGFMNCGDGALGAWFIRSAAAKCSLPFGTAFVSGFLCNVLVTLGVLMSFSGRDGISRMAGAWMPVCFFVLCGFEHSVAGMFTVSAGLMAASVPRFAALAGTDLSALTVPGFLFRYLLPVTLGNTAGGAAVGWTVWFAFLRGRRKGAS